MDGEVRFYFDEMVAYEIAERLRQHRIDVLTCVEAETVGYTDSEQLAFAREQGRVLVTRDEDYLIMNARGVAHAGIAYYKQEVRSPKEIAEALMLIHGVLTAEDMQNHVEYI